MNLSQKPDAVEECKL